MRVLVMGAGGVGGYFGSLLARSGEDVCFVARGPHLKSIQSKGIIVRSINGSFTLPAKAVEDPAKADPPDVILFCVKTYDTDAALDKLAPIVGSSTVIVPLQNGVESAETIGRRFGHEKVLGGLAYIESYIAAPGVIEQRSQFRIIEFGELDGSNSGRASTIQELFEKAGVDCRLSNNIQGSLWRKLIWAAAAALMAVSRSTVGEVLRFPQSRDMFLSAMREVYTVGVACGVKMDSGAVDQTFETTKYVDPGLKSSMQRDLETHSRLEVDSINGAVMKFGLMHGVATPVNAFAYNMLKLEDQRNSTIMEDLEKNRNTGELADKDH